jgi:hypothetical protein
LRLDTGERRILVEGGTRPHYISSSHLLFARGGRRLFYRSGDRVMSVAVSVKAGAPSFEAASSCFRARQAELFILCGTNWLSGVIIVYPIWGELLRFVTDWDLTRWGIDPETLHEPAMDNLTQTRWDK